MCKDKIIRNRKRTISISTNLFIAHFRISNLTSGSQGTILVLVPTNPPFHAFDAPMIEFVIVTPHSLLHFDLFEHLSIELPSNVCIHHSRNSINLLIVSNLQKFSVTVSVLDYNTVAHGELHKGFVE